MKHPWLPRPADTIRTQSRHTHSSLPQLLPTTHHHRNHAERVGGARVGTVAEAELEAQLEVAKLKALVEGRKTHHHYIAVKAFVSRPRIWRKLKSTPATTPTRAPIYMYQDHMHTHRGK